MRSQPSAAGPVSVLLAEDESDARTLVRILLERSGRFEVVAECDNGLDAVEAATALQPDIVLLDILMPALDGRRSLPRILAGSPRSMIVVLSALRAEDEAAWLLARGAFAYLEKTAITSELADLLLDYYRDFTVALNGETVVAPSALRPALT